MIDTSKLIPTGRPEPGEPVDEKPFLVEREEGSTMSGQDMSYTNLMDGYGWLTDPDRENIRFRLKTESDPTQWCSIIGATVQCSPHHDRQWLGLSVVSFELGVLRDRKTGLQKEVRRQANKRSFSGEIILPLARIGAWRFVTEYLPDATQIGAEEWRLFLGERAELIARDRRAEEDHIASGSASHARALEAAEAQSNPQAYLAKSIACGVAQALRELGIKSAKN